MTCAAVPVGAALQVIPGRRQVLIECGRDGQQELIGEPEVGDGVLVVGADITLAFSDVVIRVYGGKCGVGYLEERPPAGAGGTGRPTGGVLSIPAGGGPEACVHAIPRDLDPLGVGCEWFMH